MLKGICAVTARMLRVRRSPLCAVLAAGMAVAVFAAPAMADRDDDDRRGRGRDRDKSRYAGHISVGASCAPAYGKPIVGIGHGHGYGRPTVVHVHDDRCGCDPCFAKREYERGFNRGEARGSNAGFRDGFNGACFDDRPRQDDLCGVSRPFIDGYRASFASAYRCAFEKGRLERSRSCAPAYGRPRGTVIIRR